MKYKIYKLIHKGKVVYIGRTIRTLHRRLHSGGYKNNPNGLHEIYLECEIELIEETDDVSRERYWIEYYGIDNLLNDQRGEGLDVKEYHYNKNKKYYEKNRDDILRRRRERYKEKEKDDKSREKQKLYMRDWRKKKKENG